MAASSKINSEIIGNIMNPFIVGSGMVFSTLFNIDVVRGDLLIQKTLDPEYNIIAAVPFKGSVEGCAYFSMGFNVVNRIMERLSPGVSLEEIKQDYHDYIGEVAFMITGNALTMLHDDEYNMSLPEVFDKNEMNHIYDDETFFLKIDIISFFGVIELIIQVDAVEQ